MGRVGRLLRWLTLDQWEAIERENPPRAERLTLVPLVVLVVAVVCLTVQEYWGERGVFMRLWPRPSGRDGGTFHEYYDLMAFGWWTGFRVLGYLVIPVVTVLVLPGQRLRDYGFFASSARKHVAIGLGLYLLILPVIILASRWEGFQATYPFYKLANRSSFDFWTWEILYALQFLSLEFFFRGFLLHSLKRVMGVHAIWVMMVLYVMIHYGKPMPETLGAIVAGLVLGTIALRTRSIWSGVVAHVAVALTMDLLALGYCPPPGQGACRGH